MNKTELRIRQQLNEHPIILYMKGTPDNPECGFSARTVAALKTTGMQYTFVNVMAAPFIREQLPKISKWPTYPQLFVNGKLIGGCDIVEAMATDGTLLPAMQKGQQGQLAQPAILNEPQTIRQDNESSTISHDEVKSKILQQYPDAEIMIEGESDTLIITVISDRFVDQSMLQQQQGIMATLADALNSGRLHAVSIKSFTPEQWQKQPSFSQAPLLQIQL